MFDIRRSAAALVFAFLFLVSVVHAAGTTDVANRLPHNGNAIMVIDVAKLLDSPLGKKESWQSKLMSGYADRPLAVPAAARVVALTGFVHPVGLETLWQAAVADLPNAPRIEPMLQRQGGYLDDLSGRKAAWTPRDIYYVQLDQNTLGVLRPGDRQALARWVDAGSNPSRSPYITDALSKIGNSPVLFALDLTNSAGAGAVHYAFLMGSLPSLETLETGRDALFAAIGSVKGLRLRMNVDSGIQSELTIDFEKDVSALGSSTKAFVADVLATAGLSDPALESWEFKASGKSIVGSGQSNPQAIGRLIALLSPGDIAGEAAAPNAPKPDKPAPPDAPQTSENPVPVAPASPAAASQAYYRAIARTLDQMAAKASPTQSAAWLHAQAKMIEQLPLVGVDPVLVEWGNSIAGAFNRAGQTLAIGQQQAQVAAQGIASPTGTATAGGVNYDTQGGSTTDTPESRAAFRNAQQQRRQAAQQQRAAAADQAVGILTEAMATRGNVRSLMTQKYNVEF